MDKKLMELASRARENSYSPYSNFKVGAAVLTGSGKIYTGCNIENASYTPTICAERTAVFKAISEGEKELLKIAIVGQGDYTYPCGVCRQVLREFNREIEVLVGSSKDDYRKISLEELLPNSFGREDIKGDD